MSSEHVSLPISKELKDGLLSTQSFYSKSNSLSIAHPRTQSGHADLADAVTTSVYESSRKRFKDERPKQKIHYDSPLVGVWAERNGVEKPFNWLHKVEE